MNPFLEGIIAGYGIAIPVGAIAVLIIQTSLACGFRTGFMAGAGAASADFFYAILAAAAGAAIGLALEPYERSVRLASGLLLVGLAIWGFRQGFASRSGEGQPVEACRPWPTYLKFLSLTLVNPLTVVYFTAYITGRGETGSGTVLDALLFVAGAGLSSLSWQTLLALIGSAAQRGLAPGFRRAAVFVGNLIVLGLGAAILFGSP